MANKRFSDFDLKSPIVSSDYFVGFKGNGLSEFKATFAEIQLSLPEGFKYQGDDIKAGLKTLSGNWEETHTLMHDSSASWISTYSSVYELSSKWLDAYTTYSANSATYLTSETDSQVLAYDESQRLLSITNGNIISLSSLADKETAFEQLSAKYEEVSTIVQQNSAQWLDGGSAQDLLFRSLSSNFVSTYNTVAANSAVTWNALLNISTHISPLTSNWQSTYTTVLANSASKWTNLHEVEYNTLSALKASNSLNSGQYYKITDFALKWWNQSVNDTTVKVGPNEPLIVFAVSSDKFACEAYSETYPDDIVYYDFDAKSSYSWGTINTTTEIPDFKGWIYKRVNKSDNIDIPWDWRNITVNCCQADTTSISAFDSSVVYNRLDVVKIPTGKLYYSVVNFNVSTDFTDPTAWLPLSPFNESQTYYPTDESGPAFVTRNRVVPTIPWVQLPPLTATRIQQPTFVIVTTTQSPLRMINCRNIKIDSGYCNVIYGADFRDNNIGSGFCYNLIDADFKNNSIDNNFSKNYISHTFESNSIGDDFKENVVRNNFGNNTIQDDFISNNIGVFFSANNCYKDFSYNIVGNSFFLNKIENTFYGNIIGNNFNKNDIGNSFLINIISDNFKRNQIQDSCLSFFNLTSAVHFYGDYHTNVFRNYSNEVRLSYFNSTDQLVVTDVIYSPVTFLVSSLSSTPMYVTEDIIQKVTMYSNTYKDRIYYQDWDGFTNQYTSTIIVVNGIERSLVSHTTERIGQMFGYSINGSIPQVFGEFTGGRVYLTI